MEEQRHTKIVFSFSDDVYINPEKSLMTDTPVKDKSYHIFTGVGLSIVFKTERFHQIKRFYKTKKDADKKVRMIKRKHPDLEVISTEECFFAYAVEQNTQDPFLNAER